MANYCKYYKEQRYVSFDSGATWQPLSEYRKGELYEYNSPDCGYSEIYRWITMSGANDYWCDGTTKKTLEQHQVSYDGGQNWQDIADDIRSGDTVIQYNSEDCGYSPSGYSDEYLTFIPTTASSSFYFSKDVQYTLDSGQTWTTLAANTYSPFVSAGQKIMWKRNEAPSGATFFATSKFIVQGNTMSLLYSDNFRGKTSLGGTTRALYKLFSANTKLVSAENMVLPATVLTEECYRGMFGGCTSLVGAPQLSATTLAPSCYEGMFFNCTSLTTAPQLPAMSMAFRCYDSMFGHCTSLTTVPILSATTLAKQCYEGMFVGCTSLTTVPTNMLPATTLAEFCYESMFENCTSLTVAPTLSAETLVFPSYDRMFSGCTSLTAITCMANSNYLIDSGGQYYCTTEWVCGVAANGTFTKKSNSTWENHKGTDCSAIPNGWTIINV